MPSVYEPMTNNINLEDKFNKLLSEYTTLYSSYLNRIQEKTTFLQNNPDAIYNAYVNKPASSSKPEHRGCYSNLENMLIKQSGNNFNLDQCKTRANDTGSNFFALKNTNGSGMGECYVGNAIDIQNVERSDIRELLWSSNTPADSQDFITLFELGMNGVMYLLNDSKRIIWSTKDKLLIPNNCSKDQLPFINNIVATFNSICFGDGSTDENLTNENNNQITQFLNEQIPPDTNISSFNNLKDFLTQPFPTGDYAFCDPMNLNVKYQCGEGVVKDINMENYKQDEIVPFQCDNEVNQCKFFMKLENDGDLNVYQGSVDDLDNILLIYSTNSRIDNVIDTGNLKLKMQLQKFDRSYMLPGETLKKGEFLFSDNGVFALLLQDDNNLSIIYNFPACNKYSTENINDKTFSLYETSFANKNGLGSVVHVNSLNQVQKFNDEDTKFIDNYTKYNNYDSAGNTITDLNELNEDECKVECNKLTNCGGFVYDKVDERCFLKDKNTYPFGKRLSNPNKNLYTRNKDVKNNKCNYNYTTMNSDQYNLYDEKSGYRDLNNCNNNIFSQEDYIKLYTLYEKIKLLALKIEKKNKTNKKRNGEIINEKTTLINNIEKDLKKIKNLSKKNLKEEMINYRSMENDTMKLLISNNYKYLSMSILAIVVVFGCIKINKN